MNNHDQLRYPIGRFAPKESYTQHEIKSFIDQIEDLPGKVETVIKNFSAQQFEQCYREGGWTARQVLHHLADSHTNAYIRFKWTLTEDTPTIKAYNEKAWAETPETALDPILSVNFLKTLHVKWVALLKLLEPEDLRRAFIHPETKNHVSLERLIALYAWHGEHHLGHLKIIAGL
jgi:uncharacterized damage-inducible protein DinB